MAKTERPTKSRLETWLQVFAAPPALAAPFLDRQAELDLLRRARADRAMPPEPLVLLAEPGLGATALAAHWAAQWDGLVLWADLFSANGNPLPILAAWAQRLGQPASYAPDPAQRARALQQMLLARTEPQPPLLVVLDEARAVWLDGIHPLWQALPDRATLLITTSEPAVAAMLSVPPQPVAPWPTGIAIQLLAALSDGVLVDAFADAVARHAQGVPLALALAARAAAQHSPQSLLARLRDPGPWLDVLRQDVQMRQDPVSHCLAANYALLETSAPADACLWRWLGALAPGVFSVGELVGVLTAAGHTQLLNGLEPGESPASAVSAALQRLAGRALVEPVSDWGYRLHPRLYLSASALLEYAGERAEAHQAHRASYLAYSLAYRNRFDELEIVRANALLGMDRAVEAGDHAAVRGYAWALTATTRGSQEGFLWTHGYWQELRRRLEQARWAAQMEGEDWDAAAFTGNLAILLQDMNERASARRELEYARSIFRRLGDVAQEIVALDQLTQLARQANDAAAAADYEQQVQGLRQRQKAKP